MNQLTNNQVLSRCCTSSGFILFSLLLCCTLVTKAQEAGAPELVIQGQHTGPVNAVAYSPRGDRIASASDDFTIKLWDTYSGLLIKTFGGHSSAVSSIAFSPKGDFLISGSVDGTVRLWDVIRCEFVRSFPGHASRVNTVAFSPNGKVIATGGGWFGNTSDNSVRLWDVQTGIESKRLKGHKGRVLSIAFSPDGESLVSGGAEGSVIIWSVKTGQPRRTIVEGDGFYMAQGKQIPQMLEVTFVGFSPDGRSVARATSAAIKIWDMQSGSLIHTIKDEDNINSIAFSSDWGRVLTGGSYGGQIKLWDVVTGRLIKAATKTSDTISAISFSPDGRSFVTGNTEAKLDQWEAPDLTKSRPLGVVQDHVGSTTFSPGGNMIAWASGIEIKLWDWQQGRMLPPLKGHSSNVKSLAFSPDGKHIVSSGARDGVFVWAVDNGQFVRNLGGPGEVLAVAFSPDGETVASGAVTNQENLFINLWDWRTGRRLQQLTVPSPYASLANPPSRNTRTSHAPGTPLSVFSITFSHDGKSLAAGTSLGTLNVWDLTTGQLLQTYREHNFSVTSVDFSPDNKRLVSSGTNIKLWNIGANQSTITLDKDTDYINMVKFSPDNRTIASASNDRTVKIWDPASGRVINDLAAHFSGVNSLDYSLDGKFLVSGSEDATVRIWSASSGKLLTSIASFGNNWVAYTPDGYYTASDLNLQQVAWRSGDQIRNTAEFKSRFYQPTLVVNTSRGIIQPITTSISNPVDIPVRKTEALSISASEDMLRDRWKKVRYYALVIGNGRYRSSMLGTLQTPVKNAEDLSRILDQVYGFEVESHYNASRLEILGALEGLAQRTEINDQAAPLIYYTGHGTYNDATNVAFWQPSDANPNVPGSWISADDVISRVRAIKARHILIISDSCFAGGFFDEQLGSRPQLEEPVRYLMDSMENPSRMMITSGGKQFVDAVGPEGHTMFTHGLLLALRDSNSNIFTAEEMYRKIHKFVINNSPSQRPRYDPIPNSIRSLANPGDFVFVRKK